MKRLEGSIQRSVVSWAKKKLGLRCDKLSSGSRFQGNSLPDYIFWIPGGKPTLIEFKAEDKLPTKLQQETHDQLRELGYEVFSCDNVTDGRLILQAALDASQVSGGRSKVPANPRRSRAVPGPRAGKD